MAGARPELIVQDFKGHHNADPHLRGRLMRGASWKHQRIVVLIPSANSIPAKVYLSHMNLVYPPNNAVTRVLALGMEVGEAYTAAIDGVLAHPQLSTWEYILTLEHDNMPPPDGVLKLVEQMEAHPELDCIGGLYFTKGHGGVAQIWGDPKDPTLNFRPQVPQPGALMECCGTGMGFNLWRMKLFKDARLRKPWFKTLAGKQGCATQDLYFWGDARKYGHRCAVDCAVTVGHYDESTDTIW